MPTHALLIDVMAGRPIATPQRIECDRTAYYSELSAAVHRQATPRTNQLSRNHLSPGAHGFESWVTVRPEHDAACLEGNEHPAFEQPV